MEKLLAVDLDGTLFYPPQLFRRIPKKNVKFLQHWIDSGNKVVLITSRSYEFTQQLIDEIKRPVDHINFSGGQIRLNNEIIRDVPLNNEILSKILKDIRENHKTNGYFICTDKYPAVLRDNANTSWFWKNFYRFWYSFQGVYKENYFLDNEIFDNEVNNGKVYIARILLGVGKKNNEIAKELNKVLRADYPEIESAWTGIIIELTPKGDTKAQALSYYLNKTNFNNDDVYVVGDSGNDITMFAKFHKHSYCMKHAFPTVKKYAKNVISRVYKLEKLLTKGEDNE